MSQGALEPKPIALPKGVTIFAIDVNGRRYPVQAYPWPDPTATVEMNRWDFHRTRPRVMLAGIYGTTGYSVPIRVVCPTPCFVMEAAEAMVSVIMACGWKDCLIERMPRDQN